MLERLVEPIQSFLQQHPEHDPLSVLIAQILSDNAANSAPTLGELLDNTAYLRAGRAYLGLLLENDRLPRGEQLTLEELSLPRGLLIDFFGGENNIQTRAQEVLGLVERKFSQRAFKQATILLQLFETDQATRMQNERKLFYEDMIQRLGIRRRIPLSPADVDQVHEHFQAIFDVLRTTGAFAPPQELQAATRLSQIADLMASPNYIDAIRFSTESPDDFSDGPTMEFNLDDLAGQLDDHTTIQSLHDPFLPMTRSFDWLAARHQIHFCLLARHPREIKTWNDLESTGTIADSNSSLTRFVPPLRWRSPADLSEIPLTHQLVAHFTEDTFREYFFSLTRSCYFLLLAVGDTGMEDFLDSYFDWLKLNLDVDGTHYIDRLHRQSTLDNQTLNTTLQEIYDEYIAPRMNLWRDSLNEDDLREGIQSFLKQMTEANFTEIAPGHYDLGSLILDHILSFQYPTTEFAFKVHRIV